MLNKVQKKVTTWVVGEDARDSHHNGIKIMYYLNEVKWTTAPNNCGRWSQKSEMVNLYENQNQSIHWHS